MFAKFSFGRHSAQQRAYMFSTEQMYTVLTWVNQKAVYVEDLSTVFYDLQVHSLLAYKVWESDMPAELKRKDNKDRPFQNWDQSPWARCCRARWS